MIENYNKQIANLISRGDLLLFKASRAEPLSNYANVLLGGTPSRAHPEYWDGDISWINSGAITGSPAILECSEKITKLGVQKSATKCANAGETVLSIIEPSKEKVSLVLDNEIYFNQSVICISSKKQLWQGLLFFASRKLIDDIKGYATGAAQQSINKDLVENEQITVPDDSTIQKLETIKNRIINLEHKIRVLMKQKELLLSKYF